jgi:TolA-binding protein
MEPPFWYYPVHQSLGAALLAQGKAAEAEEAFRQALKRSPNNGWAAAGLLRAAEMRGDAEGAGIARQLLQRSWFGDTPPPVDRL